MEPLSLLESVASDFVSSRQRYQGGPIASLAVTTASTATTTIPPAIAPVAEKEPLLSARAKPKAESNGSAVSRVSSRSEPAARVKAEPAPRVKPEPKIKQEVAEVPMDTSGTLDVKGPGE